MRLDISLFKDLAIKFVVGEVIIFTFAFFIAGYIINKDDPLFMEDELRFMFHLLPIVVITLFYGLMGGLAYYAIFTLTAFFMYENLDNTYLLSLLLILLLLSEFWFYWDRKIKTAEEKFAYADSKLRDLSRDLFLVKLSHDQLERFYITNPISLRKLLFEIKSEILNKQDINLEEILEKAFKLVVINFNVESGGMFELDDKGGLLRQIATIGEMDKLDLDDSLVKFCIEKEQIAYISNVSDNSQTKYLAAIPIFQKNKIKYIFVIHKIQFLNLNLDNLLSINLVLDYVVWDIDSLQEIKPLYHKFREFGIEFIKEVFRMYKLYNRFKVDSTIVYIYIKGLEETAAELIRLNTRGLDVYTKINFKTQNLQIVAVLLPFTDIYGASVFINRIRMVLIERLSSKVVDKDIKFKYFNIDNPKRLLIEMYDLGVLS